MELDQDLVDRIKLRFSRRDGVLTPKMREKHLSMNALRFLRYKSGFELDAFVRKFPSMKYQPHVYTKELRDFLYQCALSGYSIALAEEMELGKESRAYFKEEVPSPLLDDNSTPDRASSAGDLADQLRCSLEIVDVLLGVDRDYRPSLHERRFDLTDTSHLNKIDFLERRIFWQLVAGYKMRQLDNELFGGVVYPAKREGAECKERIPTKIKNTIRCLKCSNILGVEYTGKKCPNPSCDYVFASKQTELSGWHAKRLLRLAKREYLAATLSARELKAQYDLDKEDIAKLPSSDKYGKIRYARSDVSDFIKKRKLQGRLI